MITVRQLMLTFLMSMDIFGREPSAGCCDQSVGDINLNAGTEKKRLQASRVAASSLGATTYSAISRSGITPYQDISGCGTTPYQDISGSGTTPYQDISGSGTTPYQDISGSGTTPYQDISGSGTTPYLDTSSSGTTPYQDMSGSGTTPYLDTSSSGTTPYQDTSGSGTTPYLDISSSGTTPYQDISGSGTTPYLDTSSSGTTPYQDTSGSGTTPYQDTSSNSTLPYPDPSCSGKTSSTKMNSSETPEKRITLNIIGLFAMSGVYSAGISYLLSALLAVQHINSVPNILPGYKLKINAHNTNCEESIGLDAFYSEVYNKERTSVMTLGGTCSTVTERVAPVARLWGMLMISYSTMSPRLLDKSIFPSFFRVTSPDQYLTAGRAEIFKQLNWTRIHVIYENYHVFSTLNEIMKQDLKAVGVNVESEEMFTNNPGDSVRSLRNKDARVIIASMYETKARQVACEAYRLEEGSNKTNKVWYKRVVWFFPSYFDRHWMDVNDSSVSCTSTQIRQVIGKYFIISYQTLWESSHSYVTDQAITPTQFKANYSGRELYEAVKEYIPEKFHRYYESHMFYNDGSPYQHRAPGAYDAVWALALALNNTLTYLIQSGDDLRLEHFQYRDSRFSAIMHEAMRNVTFNALSGPLSFNKAGDRTSDIELYQFQNAPDSYDLTFLGACHINNEISDGQLKCTLNKSKIVWDTEVPPVDGIQIQTRTLRINVYLRFCFWILASVGIILSMGLLGFNLINKSHRLVKMSSPRMNNVILVGCMMSYTTIFMLDIEGVGGRSVCILRTFTVVLSFSLTFGALFAKTWRVYEIFTAGHKVLNTRMLRESSLFLIVALLVVINSTVLIGWMIGSPQMPTMVNISTTPATQDNDIEYINQIQRCDSHHRVQFIWTLTAIQSVVILFGAFLAIQTRKVSFPELNDSKWIALCIYNFVVLAPVSVVVVIATEDKPEINYALESSMLFLVTMMTQCLIFVPKIIAFQHNKSLTPELDIEDIQVRCIKKFISFLCLDTYVTKQTVVRGDGSTVSLEESQNTQKTDISCYASDCVGSKHQNNLRIPLSNPLSQVESKSFRKCTKETWPSSVITQISYRPCKGKSPGKENSSYCLPVNRDKQLGDGKSRHLVGHNVFSYSCLYRSRSDSNVSVTCSDSTPQYTEDEGHYLHESLGSPCVKSWKSLTTIPVLYSTLKQDITLVSDSVLANLKICSSLGLMTTRKKGRNKLAQSQIETIWKHFN